MARVRGDRRAGLYRLTDGKLTAFVSVGPPNPREYQEVVSTTEKLGPIAAATGGSVRRVSERAGDTPRIPTILTLASGARFSGGDFIALRNTDASWCAASVFPVFLGFVGLVLLLASLLMTWLGESRLAKKSM